MNNPNDQPSTQQVKSVQSHDPARADSDAEDAALVAQAAAGDASAFERLFVKHRQAVFAAVWRVMRNEDDALDVVQDAFVKAYHGLKDLRGETHFYPWLRRIAVNLAIDRLRRARRGIEVSLDEHRIGEGDEERHEAAAVVVSRDRSASPPRQAALAEFNEALAAALLKLSDEHRAVFMLHAAEGMSYKEIADALDCNIGTVMSRLFYARKRLQQLLAPHLEELA